MVIGIDASRANQEKRTGTEWYSFYILQELKKIIPSEHQVILYTKEKLKADLAEIPKNWKVKILNWPPKFLWTQFRLSWHLLWHKIDLLYIPAHTIPFVHPKKIALVVHDVGFHRQDKLYNDQTIGYQAPLAKKIINFLVRFATLGKYSAREQDYHQFSMKQAAKHATKIITPSHFSKKEILDIYSLDANNITVIPNGFCQRAHKIEKTATAESLFKKYKIASPFLLFIGRIEYKKNIPKLIEAFHLLKTKYHFPGFLVLAGSPGYGFEAIQEKITKYNLKEQVLIPGWVNEQDLAQMIKTATVFVFPSLYEGFGIPVLEAMEEKIPVACSAIPALL